MSEHQHSHSANKRVLFWSFIIITLFMIVEVIGGIITNSLALLSDAGHMLSDAISLGIALMAILLGEKAASNQKTFGYKRIEILAATLNGITLIAIALYIFYEAVQRFVNPPEVASTGMLIISVIGLLVNVFVAWFMMSSGDTEQNLNMRGAFYHVLSDMLGSMGAIVAAICIMLFGWKWADPLASIIVACLVLRSGVVIMKQSVHILMEGTPVSVNSDDIVKKIECFDGVLSVHDLHIWTITSGFHALSCHIVVEQAMTVSESANLIADIEHKLLHEDIQHVTIQVETNTHRHEDAIYCTFKPEVGGHHHHHH